MSRKEQIAKVHKQMHSLEARKKAGKLSYEAYWSKYERLHRKIYFIQQYA